MLMSPDEIQIRIEYKNKMTGITEIFTVDRPTTAGVRIEYSNDPCLAGGYRARLYLDLEGKIHYSQRTEKDGV